MTDGLTTPSVNTNQALNSIRESSNPSSRASEDRQTFAEDFDQFLLLLTTQLQNQDPTEPLDTNEFTNQLVMFASVEQQIAQNENLENLSAVLSRSTIDSSVNYIGKTIDATGSSAFLDENGVEFAYSLPATATAVDVTITDSRGRAVHNIQGATGIGRQTVFWDGISSINGQRVDNGEYRIVVNATGPGGSTIDATTFTTGNVSAVEVDEQGSANLVVGDNIRVPVDRVQSVRG